VAEDSKNKNSSQEPSPITESYFARVPYTLFDARESGEITPSMFLAMLWLYKWADWSTGSVPKMCAERLVWATDAEVARRTFQEALYSLAEAGWIISHCPRRGSRPYRVDICNYVALSGAHKGKVLNPSEIKVWRKPRKGVRAGNRAVSAQGDGVDAAQGDRAVSGEANGEANGEASAPTMRDTTENHTRDSSETSSEPSKTLASEPCFYAADLQRLTAENQEWLRMEQKEIQSGKRHGPLFDADNYRKFETECKAIGVPWGKEIETAWQEVIRPFQTPPPAPKPAAPQATHHGPSQTVLASLTDAGENGMTSRDLATKVYGTTNATGKILCLVANLRKKHFNIVLTGTDHYARRFVLRKN
jgi:hypothetical protein